ncbi:hypothetical protein P4T18_18205 [Bacillus inaquosorum]|uniref:hypothetical protein n=1 Tax=Bacillus inaquosorum TaxID=483913 RepID=UPI002E21F546|nr:hypothetical protein [Bacillus inaquosorum]
MVEDNAQKGDMVIVTESYDFPVGHVDTVQEVDSDRLDGSVYLDRGANCTTYLDGTKEDYRVLVPAEAEADEPQPADLIDVVSNLATRVADLERTIKRQKDEIDTLHKDNRTLGEELARLKEPKDNEINYEDAALVFIQRKVAGPVEVYQDGKRLRGVISVNINAKVGELTTHTIEFGTGRTAGERL